VPRLEVDTAAHRTPYEVISKVREPRPASPQLLLSLSRQIEYKAADPSEPTVLLAGFQETHRFDRRTRDWYARTATRATMVGVLGVAMEHQPAEGVRGTALPDDDPLAREWVVIVVGPHFSAALVAVEHPCDDPASPRQFSYAITHDRDLVIAAAQPLLQRMRPLSTANSHSDPFWRD
jgi:DICT domain-containing protein